ncbi:MBL fold metallo-hydrolase [Betaproteobacteria bacterium SCN1]|jgi:glyoxylase-like metal-dependent hydrolase (beta-lactamase superfamily II)|nr:MBL fold metallo-hydrolase [Betaproteobacteria bacterium SCN1]MBN8759668.1 MBL fold metallo-hydrolase [Thiobacillus sp.]ODU89632.1 MAG: hydrolase [Thiobacillus sp. SCN 65-179]OJW37557.1 MAG: MBL fold metallo-hydrolase [Thiobacillus sp. 65-69]
MRIVPLLAALVFSTAALAGPSDTVRPYSPDKVATGVWVIHGPQGLPSVENQSFMNNPAWIVTKDGVVVIDPGSSVQVGRMVVAQIRKTTQLPVTHVFNTHVHGDHWLGNHAIVDAWPKATMIAHPDMIQRAKDGADKLWLQIMSDMTQGYTNGTRAEIPTVEAADGQTFKIGGKTFRIHSSTDGHSKTDLMIEMVEDRILFTGDNVLNRQVMNMRDATFKGVMKETDRALALNVKTYIPGHGKTGGRDFVEEQKAWFGIFMPEVRRMYDEGLNDYEMKPVLVEKLKAYQNWAEWDTNLGQQISLAILEIEQE